MRSFFKSFFASLLALVVFTLIAVLILVRMVSSIAKKEKPVVEAKSVLVLNLATHFEEQAQDNPFAALSGNEETRVPGLYDVLRLLAYAKNDKEIEGIYIQAGSNSNGFAASQEIRKALLDFKSGGKFIIAHADMMPQKAYYVANAADKIYISPQGMLEWMGYSVNYAFLKGTLDKLDIEPQIFYAGKFKSATEPLRADRMTDANKLQTTVWLNDLYDELLTSTSAARNIDTTELRRLANEALIQTTKDAVDHKLIDAAKYDDEVKDEIKAKLKFDKYERINFIGISKYADAVKYEKTGGDKIALIYAEGNIVDGKGGSGAIGGDDYRTLVRKARLDKSIKAIVFRINSGGGSALASENIWRELSLAKKEKPVIVSFGDVAASGGYYIACAADSIFAQPTTITGSIGVFGIIPNMEAFFKNKLGVTFDGVKTGPYADAGSIARPMNEAEKKIVQNSIDNIYSLFKQRVAEGRKKDTTYIDSIAQGRVWTGTKAIEIGLIDRFGGIEDAVKSAAAMAKLTNYSVKGYPEPENFFQQLIGRSSDPMSYAQQLKKEIGEENYKMMEQLKKIKEMTGSAQARLPFEFFIR